MKTRIGILSLALLLMSLGLSAQNYHKAPKMLCIAFYNVENLFDTINQAKVIDEEFTPEGLNKWNTDKYERKLRHLAKVISQIGGHEGPDAIGLAEVENRGVLEDLIQTGKLKHENLGIVHYDSPDHRGIDCAFLYKKDRLRVVKSSVHPVSIPDEPDFKTRDILLVEGVTPVDTLYFLVAHWPSRYGGEKKSLPKRMQAAYTMRAVSDSIVNVHPNAKILMMGDFNDDPFSPSVVKGLEAQSSTKNMKNASDLYTPMYQLYKDGFGTLAYRDAWNLFDIMVVNSNLICNKQHQPGGYCLYQEPRRGYGAFILNKKFLTQRSGRFRGYPKRTLVGGTYQGGYSDHFPVYLYLIKK